MFRSAGPRIAAATLALAVLTASGASAQPARPNVVIMYADNLGYGEVGIYGGVRGVPTPRLDALAREGLRLTNFNVETFCTPSRTALLTGRNRIRSGTLAYRLPVTGMSTGRLRLPRSAAIGLYERALRQVARGERGRPGADQPGLRRVVRHSRLEQRVATQHLQQYAVHLGRPRGHAVTSGQGVQSRDAAHDRSRGDRPRGRLHNAQPARVETVLSLCAVHARAFPDAAASRLCRQDRRRRHRRRDGRDGSQRRRHSRYDREARHRAQYDRDLGERRRGGGQAPVARHCRTLARVLQHRHGRRHPHAVHDSLARSYSG